jgi:hypothetical protein
MEDPVPVMDPETLLDVFAAIPGVYVVEKGTQRAYRGWPKVEVTLALDPREPTPPEFTVRIGETDKPQRCGACSAPLRAVGTFPDRGAVQR